jgi:hypothetical protein
MAEVDLDDLGVHYFNAVTDAETANTKMTELKSRVIKAMEGKNEALSTASTCLALDQEPVGCPTYTTRKEISNGTVQPGRLRNS